MRHDDSWKPLSRASKQKTIIRAQRCGRIEGAAHSRWSLARIAMQQNRSTEEAAEHLVDAYAMLLKLGRLEGICFVGLDLGRLLAAASQWNEARKVLERSRDGFRKLGLPDQAAHAQTLLDRLPA